MWKVKFNETEVFTSKKDVEAIQFALAIHQSSNVPHRIEVVFTPLVLPGEDMVVCLLQQDPLNLNK